MQRVRLRVEGTVQGVGFRPFVHRLAAALGLSGRVVNDGFGVDCEVQGPASVVETFRDRLIAEPPPLASISRLTVTDLIVVPGESGFVIEAESGQEETGRSLTIPPDAAPCQICVGELFDPDNRRYRYPFTCCVDCGPRFTVIDGLPYDRARTSMAEFGLCSACRHEYTSPGDRRHHAQAICCVDCGPRLWLRTAAGSLDGEADALDPLATAVNVLVGGQIIALKGVGGYQLLCRADDESAVRRLRQAKRREEKPFALLVADQVEAEALVDLTDVERRALLDPAAPIILARPRSGADTLVAPSVAPDTSLLGVMLPSSPLHLLLSTDFAEAISGRSDQQVPPLVCTSGNVSDEPIAITDDEALAGLGPIVEVILGHDRAIERRADDSVGRAIDDKFQVLRRARGFAPRPIRLPAGLDDGPVVLAVGAELKNTVGLAVGGEAVLSVHLGDLDHPTAIAAFETTVSDMINLIGRAPDLVAHDLHPEYLSTKFALAADLAPTVGVQHHHAHLAACLTDNGIGLDDNDCGAVLGVTFDGLGWGHHETLWGGEFLLGDASGCRRIAHLRSTPMPGGEVAILEPWRMAVAHLKTAGLDVSRVGALCDDRLDIDAVAGRIGSLGHPVTTSMGRLFDVVAVLCGVPAGPRIAYEGQAAIQLEQLAWTAPEPLADHLSRYPVSWIRAAGVHDGRAVRPSEIDPAPMLAEVLADLADGVNPAIVAARFHRWAADVVRAVACGEDADNQRRADTVALTGGVFQSRLLSELTSRRLVEGGFHVLQHRQVPANDGGIALGQLAVARASAASHSG